MKQYGLLTGHSTINAGRQEIGLEPKYLIVTVLLLEMQQY